VGALTDGTPDLIPWATFGLGSLFTLFMFWLESKRHKTESAESEIRELLKRVYDPLLAEIKDNQAALENLEIIRKYKQPRETIRWEDLGFSTAEWEYVKTSGYYHVIDAELAKRLHRLYGHFHEIKYWGTDVEGVLKGIKQLAVKEELENLSKIISEKISKLRETARLPPLSSA
jgi:hypothetical protein